MATLLAFIGLSAQELMIVLVIFLVLFGGSKLPSLMRNMGRSVNEFKKGIHDDVDPDMADADDQDEDSATA